MSGYLQGKEMSAATKGVEKATSGTPAPAKAVANKAVTLPALTALRATDAGRIVGPKAAHLGELANRYPGKVSPALAIPFGVYRSLLDRTSPDGIQTMFDWLQLQHRLIDEIDDPALRAHTLREFLETARGWFARAEFPAGLVDRLRADMEALFGADGRYGVYVRSDTNLEDLPAFSGAGLNRTVPNVVGFDAVLDAIRTVWASPFSERAYSWRQLAMDRPEQVYVSVLLHKTVASDKSGVMVTADPERGDTGTIFVSANEGAGGAVDGQSAESLRIRLADGRVDLIASATEPTRRTTLKEGGLRDLPARGDEVLLIQAEVAQLMALARSIPAQYPQLRDAAGGAAPADVEFAFADGRLYLLQIRPYLQSTQAQRSTLLRNAPHIIWPLTFVLPHAAGLRPVHADKLLHLGGAKRDLVADDGAQLLGAQRRRVECDEVARGGVEEDAAGRDDRRAVEVAEAGGRPARGERPGGLQQRHSRREAAGKRRSSQE